LDFLNILFGSFETGLLIFARSLGMIAFNPLLSRRNVPVRVKIGIALLVAYIVTVAMDPAPIDSGTIPGVYALMIVKEAFVGIVLGFITDMFLYTVQMAGEAMDMQIGLGMAKVFDPVTNTQSSVMGSVLGVMVYLYFFITNSHLSVIALFALSYDVVPIGNWAINTDVGLAVVEYFSVVLALVLKLALPIVVAAMIVQFCVGIAMKAVPNVPIMMLNIQVKVLFGFLVLVVVAAPISYYIDHYLDNWLEALEYILPYIAL
jgi:flagellar biosynthetic protein FliR